MNVKKYVEIAENIGLMAVTGLAAGTLSVAWITMFLLANWKEEGEVKDVHSR